MNTYTKKQKRSRRGRATSISVQGLDKSRGNNQLIKSQTKFNGMIVKIMKSSPRKKI